MIGQQEGASQIPTAETNTTSSLGARGVAVIMSTTAVNTIAPTTLGFVRCQRSRPLRAQRRPLSRRSDRDPPGIGSAGEDGSSIDLEFTAETQ
jgi:hypothetical protein